MLKKILAASALLLSLSSFAAVDVNKANAADLDAIKGIGPSLSGKILKERNKGQFKDWPDLMHRVSGMGEKSSVKFSAQGLTVNGADYKGMGASDSAKVKPGDKPADKPSDKTKSTKS
jgi:competence protein ComEA